MLLSDSRELNRAAAELLNTMKYPDPDETTVRNMELRVKDLESQVNALKIGDLERRIDDLKRKIGISQRNTDTQDFFMQYDTVKRRLARMRKAAPALEESRQHFQSTDAVTPVILESTVEKTNRREVTETVNIHSDDTEKILRLERVLKEMAKIKKKEMEFVIEKDYQSIIESDYRILMELSTRENRKKPKHRVEQIEYVPEETILEFIEECERRSQELKDRYEELQEYKRAKQTC